MNRFFIRTKKYLEFVISICTVDLKVAVFMDYMYLIGISFSNNQFLITLKCLYINLSYWA
jgi:hypothetical protein